MARIQYHDYHSDDTTQLLNEKWRAIIPAGVYWGFTCGIGTHVSNLYIAFAHDADPDNTGSVLGKLQMPDAITVEENANQDNAALWTNNAAGGNPRMDAIVATYSYNASLPANDVTYSIVNGTVAASPVLPTLSDDQILLGWIYAPAGAADLTTCTITTAEKISLSSTVSTNAILEDLLRNGRLGHLECMQGSAANIVTVKAGDFLTKEAVKIEEAADQADLFTLTNTTTATQYRYDVIVLAHKHESSYPELDPDYFVVEGTEQAIGTKALLPTRDAIRTAAIAVDPRYTSWSYLHILAVLRVQGIGGAMDVEYGMIDKVTSRQHLWVADGRRDGSDRSTELVGPDGLEKALDLAWGRLYRSETGVTDAVGGNTFTDNSASFLSDSVQPGDYLYILDTSSAGDNGKYTISTVTETTLTTSPVWPTGSLTGLTYEVVKYFHNETLEGYLVSPDGTNATRPDGNATAGGANQFDSVGSAFQTYAVEQGDLLYIFDGTDTDDNGFWRILQVNSETRVTLDADLPTVAGVPYQTLEFCIIKNRTPKATTGRINVDGIFHTGHTVHVPSHTALKGAGEYARILGDVGEVVNLGGFQAEAAAEDVTDVQVDADQTGVPAGHWRWQVSIRVAYQSGDDLYKRRFSRNDIVEFHRVDTGTKYGRIVGFFEEYDATVNADHWSFKCIVPKVYRDNPGVATAAADFNGKSVQIRKRFTGAEDVAFGDSGSRAHTAVTRYNEVAVRSANNVNMRNVSCEGMKLLALRDCAFTDIEIGNGNFETEAYTAATADNLYWFQGAGNNTYRNITASGSGAFIIGRGEEHSTYDGIHLRTNRARDIVAANMDRSRSQVDNATAEEILAFGDMCFFKDITIDNRYARINIYSNYSTFEDILCGARNYSDVEEYGEVQVYGDGNMLGHIRGNLTFTAGVVENWAKRVAGTTTHSGALSNRVLEYQANNIDEDRNFQIYGGPFQWNATTGLLSWTGHAYVDLPFTNGYMRLPTTESSLTLSTNGDRVVVILDRDQTGTLDATAGASTLLVIPKATPLTPSTDYLIFCRRLDDNLYFIDGTVIADGASGEIGSATPADGSVTWVKLADSAKEGVLSLLQDHVVDPPSSDYGFPNEEVFFNTAAVGYIYTNATGLVTYGSVPAGFVAAGIQVGDVFLAENNNRYRITDVSNVAAGQISLDAGLTIAAVGAGGGGKQWLGSIVQGNLAWRPSISLPTYTAASGLVTVADTDDLSSVVAGYVFVDSNGAEFKITSVDNTAPGKTVTIAIEQDIDISGAIATSCYIRTDNNPRNLNMSQLQTHWGPERVDLFEVAQDIDNLKSYEGAVNSVMDGRVFIDPNDPRVAFSEEYHHSGPSWNTNDGIQFLGPTLQDNTWFSFTGIFTDIIILGGYFNDVFLDGRSLSTFDEEIPTNTFTGTYFGAGMAAAGDDRFSGSGKHYEGHGGAVDFRLLRLPYGVHTIMVEGDAASGTRVWSIIPMVNPAEMNIAEDPGRAYVDMGLLTVSDINRNVSFPSVNAFGGRVVRYISDSTRARAWATKNMPVETGTGDVNAASNTITNVAGLGTTLTLAVNDFVRVIHTAGDDMCIRRVTGVNPGAQTITMTSNSDFTNVGATVQRYCQNFLSEECAMRHPEEEITEIIPIAALIYNHGSTMNDATNPDQTDFGGGRFANTPAYATQWAGWIQNGEYYLDPKSSENNRYDPDFEGRIPYIGRMAVSFTASQRSWFFYFVGTGIDIFFDQDAVGSTANIKMSIDGTEIGDYSSTAVALTQRYNSLLRIAQNLPMGGHVLEINSPVANDADIFAVRSFVVYQPETPSYSGMPITSANMLPDHLDAAEGSTEIFEHNMIMYPSNLHWHQWGAGANVADETYYYGFFGDVFALDIYTVQATTMTVDVYVYDSDGVWRLPSNAIYCDIVAPGGGAPNDAISFSVGASDINKWVFLQNGTSNPYHGYHLFKFEPSGLAWTLNDEAYSYGYWAHRNMQDRNINYVSGDFNPLKGSGCFQDLRKFTGLVGKDRLHSGRSYTTSDNHTEVVNTNTLTVAHGLAGAAHFSSRNPVNACAFYSPGGYARIEVKFGWSNWTAGAVDLDFLYIMLDDRYIVSEANDIAINTGSNISLPFTYSHEMYISKGLHALAPAFQLSVADANAAIYYNSIRVTFLSTEADHKETPQSFSWLFPLNT